MAVAVDAGLLAYMRESTGAIQVELRGVGGDDALTAMQRARAAIFAIPHPEEPDSPCPSYASPVEHGTRGPTFWFDVADAEAYDGLLEGLLLALVEAVAAAGEEDALLTWPGGRGSPVMAGSAVAALETSWKAFLDELEAPPTIVPGPAPSRPGGCGWSRRAAIPTSRMALAACSGPDGRIYAVGGDLRRVLKTVEAYDPATDRWSKVASLRIPRRGPGVALGGDGRIYAIGGYNAVRDGVTTVEAFDPAVNRWELVAPMATVAYNDMAATTGHDGRIFAIAVSAGIGPNVLEVYDPATGAWTPLTPPPASYDRIRVVTGPDGRIYAFGGKDWVVEVYDPDADAWATAPSPGRSRYWFEAACGGDGLIYAMGGYSTSLAAVPVATVEAYDLRRRRWSDVEPMPGPRISMALASGPGGAIFALGGYQGRDEDWRDVYYGPTDVYVPPAMR